MGQLSSLISHSASVGLFAVLTIGFVLGMRHATDVDHVVAVSTIVSRERKVGGAALIGALWGVGHTITIFTVGAGIILFTLVIPVRVGLSMEFCAGLMLVFLGWWNLRSLNWRTLPAQTVETLPAAPNHSHGMGVHTHATADSSILSMDRMFGGRSIYQWVRPLAVGLVHGLAGSAAVALLVLAAIHNSNWAVAYLIVFGVGTIAGMMIITVAIASALRYAGARSAWINHRLSFAAGLLSVCFGLLIVYQTGFAHGLFTTHPTWVPQ